MMTKRIAGALKEVYEALSNYYNLDGGEFEPGAAERQALLREIMAIAEKGGVSLYLTLQVEGRVEKEDWIVIFPSHRLGLPLHPESPGTALEIADQQLAEEMAASSPVSSRTAFILDGLLRGKARVKVIKP